MNRKLYLWWVLGLVVATAAFYQLYWAQLRWAKEPAQVFLDGVELKGTEVFRDTASPYDAWIVHLPESAFPSTHDYLEIGEQSQPTDFVFLTREAPMGVGRVGTGLPEVRHGRLIFEGKPIGKSFGSPDYGYTPEMVWDRNEATFTPAPGRRMTVRFSSL